MSKPGAISEKGISRLVGYNLRKARRGRVLLQSEAAEMLGMVQSSLSRIEAGKVNPTVVQLVKMARLYRTTLAGLLDGIDA